MLRLGSSMTLEQARMTLRSLRDNGGEAAQDVGQVTLDLSGEVAILRLDNPSARNAMTLKMMIQLGDAVAELQTWKGAGLLVCAAEPVFCAGGHLKDVQAKLAGSQQGLAMAQTMGTILDTLLCLPIISVAAVGGPAIGGGAEITTACDFRVLHRSARLHFVQAALGVAAGWGGARRLGHIVGCSNALEVFAKAEPLTPEACLAMGLADEVCQGEVEAAASAFLASLLTPSAEVTRANKGQIGELRRALLSQVAPDAAQWFSTVWGGPAHRAALADVLRKK